MLIDQTEAFLADVEMAARRLLGCRLIRTRDGEQLIGRIVETEAYDQLDAASHSFQGATDRTRVMFGPPGCLYVYFTYGMHYCCNVVTSPGAAVLIRALEPVTGGDTMARLRHGRTGRELTNGPAKLCQALQIDLALNGHNLSLSPLQLVLERPVEESDILSTPRIGISRNTDALRRFYIKNNPFVSRA